METIRCRMALSTPLKRSLPLALLLAGASAWAQAAPVGLQPFSGTYEVRRDDKPAGQATMRLARADAARWRIDLDIRGSRGLAGLTGLHIRQSTLFDETSGQQYRPLRQETARSLLIGKRQSQGVYDWNRGVARWNGDVKKSRRGREIPLQAGDMSGLLINLALVRDARPGATLAYRFVDDGRARPHVYRVATTSELLQVDDLSYDALRLERGEGGDRTTVWVAEGAPLPLRIRMKDEDGGSLDLSLIQYQETRP